VGVAEETAQRFWRSHGFEQCKLQGVASKDVDTSAGLSSGGIAAGMPGAGAAEIVVELGMQQLSFFDDYCMRFADTLQFVLEL
jgi:hypothetical protein